MSLYILGFASVIAVFVNYYLLRWIYTHYLKTQRPGISDVLFVVVPLINVIAMFAIFIHFQEMYQEMYRKKSSTIYERFFGIKREKGGK